MESILTVIDACPHKSVLAKETVHFVQNEILERTERGFSVILTKADALKYFGNCLKMTGSPSHPLLRVPPLPGPLPGMIGAGGGGSGRLLMSSVVCRDMMTPIGRLMMLCRDAGRDSPTYLPPVNLSRSKEKELGMRAPGSLMHVVTEALMHLL